VLEGIVGAFLYFYILPKLLVPGIAAFIGEGPDRLARVRKLTLLPYVVCGLTSVASGALNPLGIELVLISSVASALGGNSLLAWFFSAYAANKNSGVPASQGVPRSWGWIAASAVALAIFVGVFGRGVKL
jgi:hypothetical protein